MFSAQHKRNKLHHSVPHSDSTMFPKKSTDKVVKKLETMSEFQGQAVHDLEELLRLKTQQIDKYGYKLSHNSSYYRRHQIVRCFLWMQLNKEKDNPLLN